MLLNIKNYLIIVLGFAAVLFWGLLQSSRKVAAQDKLDRAIQSKKTQDSINKATIKGIQNEKNEKDNRDYNDDGFI